MMKLRDFDLIARSVRICSILEAPLIMAISSAAHLAKFSIWRSKLLVTSSNFSVASGVLVVLKLFVKCSLQMK